MNIGDLFVRVLGDTKDLEKSVEGVGNSPAARAGGSKLGAMFGGAIKQGIGLIGPAAGAIFAEGVNSAAQFADQIATIDTVLGKGQASMLGLDKAALKLSGDTGKPIEDITAGLYDLVSAGIPADKAVETLAASTNLAIGGLGSTADAVDAVTSAMNAYGQGTYSAAQVTDILAKAVEDGKVKTSEIGQSLATVAPIAAQAGISLEEISASYGRLTANGVPAAEVTQNMRQAIVALISPNETLAKVQAQTGINFAKLAKEKGLAVALEKLREVTGATGSVFGQFSEDLVATGGDASKVTGVIKDFQTRLGLTDKQAEAFQKAVGDEGMAQALADLAHNLAAGDSAFADSLGRVQAYQYALLTTGNNAQAFGQELSDTYHTTGLAAEQAATKMDSPVEAGKRFAAQIKVLSIEAFGPFAQSLGPMVVGLNQLGGAMGALIRPATLLGAGIGKVFGPLAGKLIGGLLGSLGGIGAKVAAKLGIELASSAAVGAAAGTAAGAAEATAQAAAVAVGQGEVAAAATVPATAAGAELGVAMGRAEAVAEVETASIGVATGQAEVGAAGSAGAAVAGGGLGRIMGGALKGAAVLAAAGLWLEVLHTYNDQKGQISAQADDIGKAVGKQVETGTLAQLEQSKAAIQAGIKRLNGLWDLGLLTGDAKAKLKAQLAEIDAAIAGHLSLDDLQQTKAALEAQILDIEGRHIRGAFAVGGIGADVQAQLDTVNTAIAAKLAETGPTATTAGKEIDAGLATGISEDNGRVAAAAAGLAKAVETGLAPITPAALRKGADTDSSFAAGVRSKRSAIDTAFEQLKTDIKNRLSKLQEIAHDVGILTSKRLAHGLKSGDEVVRAQAKATKELAAARLLELVASGGQAGKDALAKLNAAMHSKDPEVRAQARDTKKIIDAGLAAKVTPKTPGQVIGDQLNADLANKGTALGSTAYHLGRVIYNNLVAGVKGTGPVSSSTGTGGSSPSPSGSPQRLAAGGYVTGGLTLVGERGPELLDLPSGAHVTPNRDLGQTLAGLGDNFGPIYLAVDARGQSNPSGIGAAVRQGVADAMAEVVKKQRARLPSLSASGG